MRGLRIGVPRQYFRDHLETEVEKALDQALDVYRELGASIVPVDIPFADVMGAIGGPLSGVEALALHRAWMRDRPEDYGAQTIARHMSNLAIPAADYLSAVQARPRIVRVFVEQVFGQCDVVQMPVLTSVLPTIEETDARDNQGFEVLLGRITRNTRPINYLALPGLSVPAGFSSCGTPLSFQLVGRPFSEARLLRAGAAYELATAWTSQAPDWRGSAARA